MDDASFSGRLRSLRKAKGITIKDLVEQLRSQLWPDLSEQAAISRVNNFETGRSAAVTRAECIEFERVLGAEPDELWLLALQDPRKVDPEVREYYEKRASRDAQGGGFADGVAGKRRRPVSLQERIDYFERVYGGRSGALEALERLALGAAVIEDVSPGFTEDLFFVLLAMVGDPRPPSRHAPLGFVKLIRELRSMTPAQARGWVALQTGMLPLSPSGLNFCASVDGATRAFLNDALQGKKRPSAIHPDPDDIPDDEPPF